MKKPSPRQIFDDSSAYWAFLRQDSDDDFEGQHFDRKEAGQAGAGVAALNRRQMDGIRNHIKETISAFANRNVEGGLLVLGIAGDGSVKGTDHLTELQRNSITNFDNLLHHQTAEAKFHDCMDETGSPNKICLIYTPYTDNAICETPGINPRAWLRSGSQNVSMTQEMRERLKNQKRIVDFEATYCCPFNPDDLDHEVLTEFRKMFHPESANDFTDERLLYEAGAITQQDGNYCFTYAGLLFFAANPQRVLPQSYIRLLRFGVPAARFQERGLPTLEQQFKGPITKQIRAARTFFRESAFFKRYQKRKDGGGFIEEPEFPPNAIDEAIVNAVAHRDYRTGLSIECESYTDAFVVKNPGRILQRGADLPNDFSLVDTVLDSMPKNPKLLEWLKLMQDPDGTAYVQAISEGTKQMLRGMTDLGLPPPWYRLSENETLLKLENNVVAREAALLAASQVKSTEFGNLYFFQIRQGETPVTRAAFNVRYREFVATFRDALMANDWYIDKFGFGRIIAHRRGTDLGVPADVKKIIRFYPAYEFQVREYFNHFYLCVDYKCHVLNVLRLHEIAPHFSTEQLTGRRCVASKDGWREGRISSFDNEFTKVYFFDSEVEEQVPSDSVIPNCSLAMLETVLQKERVTFDLSGTIKKFSLASKAGAARERSDKITALVQYIANTIFPIQVGEFEVNLTTEPIQLVEQTSQTDKSLRVFRLSEPTVEFRQHHAASDVRKGITEYGAYDNDPHTIELVPICESSVRRNMVILIERLKTGKYKYRGAERTFATKFTYSTVITVDEIGDIRGEVERLLREHPDWEGDKSLQRLFLVHTPEQGYAKDDVSSPYYVVKRLLLEKGIPCQMVDTPTLLDANWKDLNLALNITAKCGITPWVLPDAIPDADFFIGLSYTSTRDGSRLMGFANVFTNYGKWLFYSGNTAFDYDQKSERLASLVEGMLTKLANQLSPTPRIIFHYSEKLSKEDRNSILTIARKVYPEGTFVFVWVNSHHNVRFFDNRPETDGSLRRGSYVQASKNKIYLSTTGYNPFRRAMGTPKPLEVTEWVSRPEGLPRSDPDLRVLAVQVLNLTKLNWASTDSFCGEPITLKYAGDIAYLTAAFLRRSQPFTLHPALEMTPWFI
jgi:predicted HTH transcriptional regulator